MSDIQIRFMHPTDGRIITVTLDDTMTTQEVISELITNDFVSPNPQGYNLAIKGGAQLQAESTLNSGGVRDGDTLRIIPATDAGN